jgi:hypothetical protein
MVNKRQRACPTCKAYIIDRVYPLSNRKLFYHLIIIIYAILVDSEKMEYRFPQEKIVKINFTYIEYA